MRTTRLFFLLSLFAVVASACSKVAPPSGVKEGTPIEQVVSAPVNVAELDQSFQRTDPTDIVYALNEVKKSPPNYDVIQKVSCAYTVCDTEANTWSWNELGEPVVRINLIDVLVQAKYRGIDTVDEETLKLDAVKFLSDPNPFVVQRSLMIFAYVDNPEDVLLIENVAKQTTNDVTFRVAIIALQLMSSGEARESIEKISKGASIRQQEAIADLLEE